MIVGYRNDSVGVYANGNGDWRDSGEFDMPAKNFQSDWSHIVVVSNKTTNRTQFYLNGLYKGDSDRATGQNIYAIGNYHGGNQRFAEYLDDFRVYDVALSAEEVKGIFNEEKADTPFRFSLQTPVKLAPGKGIKATVTFSGAEKGKHAGNLLIVSDANNNPALNVPLSVEVTAFPKLVLSEDRLHFGLNQDEIEEKPLTLSNVGDADLTYEIVVSENADGPNFSNGLRAMGDNSSGQFGDGTTKTQRTKPVQVEEKGIKAIAGGWGSSLFLKEDGSLWGMGGNSHGQLGDGTKTPRSKPVQFVNGGVREIAAGAIHNLFLKEDGSLWGTGRNYWCNLGDGTRTDRTKPVQVVNGGVKAVAAGHYHSLFVKEDGSLWAMGWNNFGQLGHGTNRNLRAKPVRVVHGGVKAVAAASEHSLFVKEDGSLWAMGLNNCGQLGDGTITNRYRPVQVVNGEVTAVAGGQQHSLFLKEDGSLWAMGYNYEGQLGDGTTSRRTKPVQVVNGGVTAIAAGWDFSLFLKEDGSLWSMGHNDRGQLGDGTRTNRTKPVQVVNGGVSEIAAGARYSLFLKADGSPKTPEWLTIDQGKGKLSAGKQARIQVRANAGKISEPYVTAYLHLSSNDHEEPKRKIKVTVGEVEQRRRLDLPSLLPELRRDLRRANRRGRHRDHQLEDGGDHD